jgi:PAS domain S-box-containing protein
MTNFVGQHELQQLASICNENELILKAIEAGGFGQWMIKNSQLVIWPGTEMLELFGANKLIIELNKSEIERIKSFEGNSHFKDIIEGFLNGTVKNIETEIALPVSNQRIWVWIKGKVIAGMPGDQSEVIAGTFIDSNRYHKQVDLIKACEERYRNILNQSNLLFFINQIGNNGPEVFLEANHKAEQDFGYKPDDFHKLSFSDVFIFDSYQTAETVNNAVLNRESIGINAKGRKKDGIVIDIELNCNVILLNKCYVLLSIVNDVTQKVEAENELAKARKLVAESERLKSAFLENISHELRTPMNAIVGFSNLMSVEDLDRKTRFEYANIITSNTHLLLRLINDILDVSKIESGVLKIIHKQVNINHIISNLQDVFQGELHRINKKHISLNPVIPKAMEDIQMITDPVRLNQILNNLLYNAIKFTDKGIVEYGFYPEGNELIFFVKDTGIGIVKEKQDVIFEHFRQANDEISTKNHGGTGLGLSISKKLVELLGGRIWVESERYKGSTFYFSIPYIQAEMDNSKTSPVDLFEHKTILLVCDNEDEINLFSLYLFARSVNLLIARTAEEAMHLFSSNSSVNLAIVHQILPDMDGLDAVLSYRSLNPNTSFVVCSSAMDDNLKRRSKASGITILESVTLNENRFIKTLESLLSK